MSKVPILRIILTESILALNYAHSAPKCILMFLASLFELRYLSLKGRIVLFLIYEITKASR